jgi:hypothetical protein
MANEILVHTSGAVLCWASNSQYDSALSGYTKTHQIELANVLANAAQQGQKADLGAKRAQGYVVKAAVEFSGVPTAGGPIEYYWSSSPSATAAVGNTGGHNGTISYVSGVNGPYVPAGAAEADIDEYKQLMSFVGVLPVCGEANIIQNKVINSYFTPPEQYGSFVVKNDCTVGTKLTASGMYIAMIPVMDELQ